MNDPDDADGNVKRRGLRRFRPHQVVLVIGATAAAMTALSFVAATTFDFHDDSPIRREVFGDIPSGFQFVFYVATTALIIGAGWMMSLRARNWARGTPDRRQPPVAISVDACASSGPGSRCEPCSGIQPPGSCTR